MTLPFPPQLKLFFVSLLLYPLCIKTSYSQTSADPSRLRKAAQLEKNAILINDSTLLAEAFYLYGKTYVKSGDFPTAQEYFLKALAILEPKGESFDTGRIYMWLGDIESRRGRPENAMHNARRSEEIFKRIGSDEGLVKVYRLLVQLYELQQTPTDLSNAYNEALRYARELEKMAFKVNDTLVVAEANLLLGSLIGRRESSESIARLQKALTLYRQYNQTSGIVYTLIRLSGIYIETRQFDQASETLQNARDICDQIPYPHYDMITELDETARILYHDTGLWKDAYYQLFVIRLREREKLTMYNDSIISRLNTEFEAQKKDAALALQQRDLEFSTRQMFLQKLLITALAVLALGAVLSGVIYFRLYRKNKRISAINAHLVREQSHRVKNNFQAMANVLDMQSRALVDTEARKALAESRLRIESMALIHRRLFDEDTPEGIDLHDFLSELSENVLFACGYSDTEIKSDIVELTLPIEKAIPLGLIVNELVNNSCKYAFPVTSLPLLEIKCIRVGKNRLRLSVSDNGPGRKEFSLPSFGTELIRTQAQQLKASWHFDDASKNGTTFTIEFPIHPGNDL